MHGSRIFIFFGLLLVAFPHKNNGDSNFFSAEHFSQRQYGSRLLDGKYKHREMHKISTFPDRSLANEIIRSRSLGEHYYLRLNHSSIQSLFYNENLPVSKVWSFGRF